MADDHFGYITIDKETLGLKYVTPGSTNLWGLAYDEISEISTHLYIVSMIHTLWLVDCLFVGLKVGYADNRVNKHLYWYYDTNSQILFFFDCFKML
jgi:hypothetical protein